MDNGDFNSRNGKDRRSGEDRRKGERRDPERDAKSGNLSTRTRERRKKVRRKEDVKKP